MSAIESLAIVLHHSRSRGTDKLVLVGICNHDGDGGAWPSVETLAKYANVDTRTVRRSLRRLEALGEIQTYTQVGGPSGMPEWKRPNRYEVLLTCPATCDRSKKHRNVDLPTAPADLWIEGVTPTSGGDAHVPTPLTPTSGDPLTPTSAKLPIELPTKPGVVSLTEVQDARAVCSVCSRSEDDCRSRIATSGHEFTPRRLRAIR